jgi:pimeloyl-ACP methyl ester carboxylesterase/tetratricopeptide (TPR) repeat protein
MEALTFLVHGSPVAFRSASTEPASLASLPGMKVKQSIRVGVLRGADSIIPVSAVPGEDIVVLHIENGPELILHPEHARDLLLAQAGALDADPAKRSGRPAAGRGSDTERSLLRVPATLAWEQAGQAGSAPAQRGIGDRVVISAIHVLTSDKASDLAAKAIVGKVDAQVDPGVYKLQSARLEKLKGSTPLDEVPAAPRGEPLLVLVHGTFSNTEGTFGKMWSAHPDLVQRLFERYGERVYALDHPTLGASPITNALMLARKLPAGACLHLLTHSRGGLVAEVLARAASLNTLGQDDKDAFKDSSSDFDELQELVATLKEKRIRVERVARVACPARGTLLASKRLDAYLSVVKWALEGAQIPVLPALVEFLGDVAKHRTDPNEIPGLAAQMPDSALVQWLHAASAPVQGQLRVIAGDVQGDSITSWIKTLLADAYYWTDNDFVVQTSSMYGGAARAEGATFQLDRGGKVSHFSYFANPVTARAVVSALTQDVPDGFRMIGPLSAAGKDASGVRGADTPPNPERPAVFVLPGILGSNLKVGNKRVWLDWGLVNGLDELAYTKGQTNVAPDGPVGLVYSKLCKFLSATHDVIEFAYDWRRPIEDEARRLADKIEEELNAREASGQPVRLLAHSMGGVVARVMHLTCPVVWDRMINRHGARVLMLGTPNGGSWAPMQVLSGDDSFGNALVAFGAPFQDGKARTLMANFPGFLQLQAGLLDPAHGLGREARWKEMRDKDMQIVREKSFWHHLTIQLNAFDWGVPSQDVLDQAVNLRIRLDAQRDKFAKGSNVVMVVGHAKFTPAGYEYGNDGLVYLDAPDHGDGRVTLGSALLPGVPSWKVDCEHGKLPSEESAFSAYLDLLERGSTIRLGAPVDPAIAGAPVNTRECRRNRGARRAPQVTPDAFHLLSSEVLAAPEAQQPPLALTVINGNLTFVRQPVILGHYRSLRLSGGEKVMDGMIGGSMSESIRMGQYPEALRTSQIFLNLGENADNPLQMPRPEAVIVVGLGTEGELNAAELSSTVCKGVIAWAQRLAETHLAKPEDFELATTLIGSGGSGISAGLAARAIAMGVRDANLSLRGSKWPAVRHLYMVEVFLDRATEAWRALSMLEASSRDTYKLTGQVEARAGALRQALDTSYRGAPYDLLSALTPRESDRVGACIVYTLDTKRAREEVRPQWLQTSLVEKLVAASSNQIERNNQLGRTLFKLLVPPEMEPMMGGTSAMQIQLDQGTAGIPWELLDTEAGTFRGGDAYPWAIRVKLLRSLVTADFASTVHDATRHDDILVIGEPECNGPALPAARKEARAVHDTLVQAGLGSKVKLLVSDDENSPGPDCSTVIMTMFERNWRVVHIAGHGMLPEEGGYGGVVLSDGSYFGANEITNIRVVPSLVFINCCHLGAQAAGALLKPEGWGGKAGYHRPRFAANVAEALIKKGVRCVIAAGWAVSDEAAQTFARTFYAQLAANERFIDAVAEARRAAYAADDNTWAAYQCYGDPDWRLQPVADAGEHRRMPLAEEFATICSAPSLVLALESIITHARFSGNGYADTGAKLLYLQQRFGELWGEVGAVAEAFGVAWSEARDLQRAIEWYERARKANDGSASIRTVEQLGSLLARTAWESVRNLQDDMRGKDDAPSRKRLAAAAREALPQLLRGLAMVIDLNRIQLTAERACLCASIYKRKAMLEELRGNAGEVASALKSMEQHYTDAETAARARGSAEWYYPALNRMAATLIRDGRERTADPAQVDVIRRCIDEKVAREADFYGVAAAIELDFYVALAEGTVHKQYGALLARFDDLYRRVPAPRWWNSVRDQIDFVITQSEGTLARKEKAPCARIAERLAEIAPRSRTPEPEHVWREFPAYA